MAINQTLMQALLGSGLTPYATTQPANQLSLPTPPIAQAAPVQPATLKTIGQMIAPTAAPAGSNTLTGATTPPMFAQPAQQAQAQPVPQPMPMAQQSYSTPGPGGNTGSLNPMGILGQLVGGQGKVRKPVNIAGAFGFGVDNQADDEQPSEDQS